MFFSISPMAEGPISVMRIANRLVTNSICWYLRTPNSSRHSDNWHVYPVIHRWKKLFLPSMDMCLFLGWSKQFFTFGILRVETASPSPFPSRRRLIILYHFAKSVSAVANYRDKVIEWLMIVMKAMCALFQGLGVQWKVVCQQEISGIFWGKHAVAYMHFILRKIDVELLVDIGITFPVALSEFIFKQHDKHDLNIINAFFSFFFTKFVAFRIFSVNLLKM